jgi:prepilin-type N-terminal cleavage/methylation domain-containing protein
MATTPHNADRSTSRRGFTLTELMVVMVMIGVMVAMSVPSYQRAIEQSRADIAAANLRAIWAAERLYWLENGRYTPAADPPTPDTALQSLRDLGLIDGEIVAGTGGYTYAITSASATAFTATATRPGTSGNFTISELGVVGGTVTVGSGSGSFHITPGFQ